MRKAIAAWGAALLFGTPAAAQDGSEGSVARTADSAQRFLSEFFAQGGFLAWTYLRPAESGGYRPYHASESGEFLAASGLVAGWAAIDRCKSRLDVADMRSMNHAASAGYPPQSMSFDIDWQRVPVTAVQEPMELPLRLSDAASVVNRKPWSVSVGQRTGGAMVPLLLFDTKEEAERVGFALDFLRRECVLKSDTGF